MKQFSIMFIGLVLASFIGNQSATAQNSKWQTIAIKTSAQCEMCEERILEALAFEKGVKKASLDLETQVVTVKYHSRRTNPKTLRTAINNVGYDADDQPADPEAYEKLPACCKKPHDPDHKHHGHD